MRAITQERYGTPDVLVLQEVPEPEIGDTDLLVRVHAAGLNAADGHMLTGVPMPLRLVTGLRRPRVPVLGTELSGVVEAIGSAVTDFTVGDEIMAEIGRGSLAELAKVEAKLAVRKPKNLMHQQAAALPLTSITALKAIRDVGKVESGEHVLINGASSGVGMYAVQMAVARGAKVTGVCSTHNVEMVRSLGAHYVIDYTKDDFTQTSERFDVMIDIVSSRSLEESRRVLTNKGRYVMVGDMTMGKWLGVGRQARTVLKAPFVSQTLKPMLAKTNRPDLETIVKMVEDGTVWPVIDHVYPLEESAAAMRQVLGGHSRGKVVVAIAE